MKRILILATACLASASAAASAENGVPMGFDGQGRPTAQVTINGQGPFELVVDTAAQRSGLGAGLVERLGIAPLESGGAMLHGAAGARRMNLYRLDSVEIGSERKNQVVATELVGGGVTHTHEGVLGADLFADRRLEFDFENGRLRSSAGGAEPPGGFTPIPARLVMGTFVMVPVTIGGVVATGLIDTGAQHSIANLRLMRALGYSDDDPRLRVEQATGGATNHAAEMRLGARPEVQIGEISLGNVDVRFSDLPVFTPLGLADGPAIILGSEALRQLRGLAVDYRRQELQLRR